MVNVFEWVLKQLVALMERKVRCLDKKAAARFSDAMALRKASKLSHEEGVELVAEATALESRAERLKQI